ncbi:hypothetical protein STAS_14914, partial [Striga asiatica]
GGFGKGFVEADTHVVVGRHKSDKDGATANNNEIKSTMEPIPTSDMATDNANGATYQVLDDVFWNDPETLAAIDSILKAVERRISSDDHDACDTYHQHTSGIGVGSAHNGMPQTADKSLNIDVQIDVGQSEHAIGEEIGLHDKGHVTT